MTSGTPAAQIAETPGRDSGARSCAMYRFRPRAPARRCTVIQRAASTSSTTADTAVTDNA
ncbi:hypothetical protein ACFV0D_01775 [Streptomyces sp. NPDC059556]|uniref:hypothetical protein n=1 Tax=Streptomyces sp. NPDC059556 TaxID=3346863 RepID=UPI0036859BC7